MSINIFYNIFLPPVTLEQVSGDILSGIRRGYFTSNDKIRDKIALQSDAEPLSYSYSIEKDKPMRWMVKSPDGTVLQETLSTDNSRYYLCEYQNSHLYKRILFSKLHTLMCVEYFDDTGKRLVSIEPRKAKDDICLLVKRADADARLILYSHPLSDDDILPSVMERFSDRILLAQTNEGVVLYLADGLSEDLKAFCEACDSQKADTLDECYIATAPALGERLSAKDFNIKRNLSSAIDITMASEFSYDAERDSMESLQEEIVDKVITDTEDTIPAAEDIIEDVFSGTDAEDSIPAVEDIVHEINIAVEATEQPDMPSESSAQAPDKMIDVDGVMYSYFGDLDAMGNRSGYGRTVTPDGRTAYEGCYLDDKRSGSGSYFYKDGTLCYSGDWDQNQRSGVGVGISSHDGSFHVGNWVDNKPVGNGVRMSADGELKFVCKQLSDGSTVLIYFMPDDSVILSKYDKDGKKLGEDTVSLADFLSENL